MKSWTAQILCLVCLPLGVLFLSKPQRPQKANEDASLVNFQSAKLIMPWPQASSYSNRLTCFFFLFVSVCLHHSFQKNMLSKIWMLILCCNKEVWAGSPNLVFILSFSAHWVNVSSLSEREQVNFSLYAWIPLLVK